MHRLRQVAVHAGGEAALPVALHGVGGHRHDGGARMAGGLALADARGGLEAAHHRHLHVHQDDVEVAAGVEGEGLLAVVGHLDLVTQFAQQAQREGAVDRVVLGQQHAQLAPLLAQAVAGDEGAAVGLVVERVHRQQDGVEQVGGQGGHGPRFGAQLGHRQVGGDAQLAAARAIAAAALAGQHDDAGGRVAAVADRLGQLEAFGVGQPGADQRDPAGVPAVGAPLQLAQGGGGIGRGDGVHPPLAEQLDQAGPLGRVGHRHQHREAFEVGPLVRHGRALAQLEAGREVEDAAFARGAHHADRAAHRLDQLGADGEAQPGAAIAPGGGGVGLGEGVEDERLLLGGDADAGVVHPEHQHDLAAVAGLGVDLDDDGDFAGGGELDAVGDEVDQHLAQPVGVADEAVGHVGGDFRAELQVLFDGALLEGAHGQGHAVAQAEVDLLEIELAGLYLREVEDVVDDVEQPVGRALDEGQVFPLFVVERGVEGEVGHAEDGVHRRADLVAHVGQEVALGAAVGLRGFLGFAHQGLGVLAVADVAQVGGDHPVAAGAAGGEGDLDGEFAAVAVAGDHFEAPVGAALHRGQEQVAGGLELGVAEALGEDQVGDGLVQGFGPRDAEAAFGGGVEFEHPAFGVG